MAIQEIRWRSWATVCLVLIASVFSFAQGSPLTAGPLTVLVPQGWRVDQSLGTTRIYSPDSTPQQYLQVTLNQPQEITQEVSDYHALLLSRVSPMIPAGSPQKNGVTGSFMWTRFQFQRPGSQPETMVLFSAKSGSVYVPISVDATSEDLLTRNGPALEAMVRGATIAGAAANGGPGVPPPPPAGASNRGGSNAPVGSMATIDDYVFAPPPGWKGAKYTDALMLSSPANNTSERCFISFWPMRAAGLNLLADADRAFRDVYKQYQLRNVTPRGDPMPSSIVHGTSGQGWEYVIIRRGIAPPGSPESRLGFVMVARLNDRLAVISGLSKDPLVSACFGELQHNLWPDFFYSLSFRNWSPTDQTSAMRGRIAGVWTVATASVADQITFAPNGRYGGASASQQYHLLGNGEALTTTQGFFGDGAYTLRGNSITMTSDHGKAPEAGLIRVEDESQDEGRTWAPIMYLLRRSNVNGEEYEVRYKKTR
jgi:hypothetical protein